MYRIFAKDQLIEILHDAQLINTVRVEHEGHAYTINLGGNTKEQVVALVEKVEKEVIHTLRLTSDDTDMLFEWVATYYDKLIEAAGGVVENELGELLVIYRLDKWDLPKGKIEHGEKPDNAALREVIEETGLIEVVLQKHLLDTYHTYELKGKRVLKRTYWYSMKANKSALTPQLEENIEIAEWLPKPQLQKVLENTYENIKLVLEKI